jgi:hypothetical protein
VVSEYVADDLLAVGHPVGDAQSPQGDGDLCAWEVDDSPGGGSFILVTGQPELAGERGEDGVPIPGVGVEAWWEPGERFAGRTARSSAILQSSIFGFSTDMARERAVTTELMMIVARRLG